MNIKVENIDRPEDVVLYLDNIADITGKVLGYTGDRADFKSSVREKPGLILTAAFYDEEMVAFKLGYREKKKRFYSWLGGVLPDYQGKGTATKLMLAQHECLKSLGYTEVETRSNNDRNPMLILNLKSGFTVMGTFTTLNGKVKVVLRKAL